MKYLPAALIACALLFPVHAAPALCRVTLDVTDTDPKGLNVRAAPGGKVIATLVDKADWIELHVVGQDGDWFIVDRANQIDNNRMGEAVVIWRGHGYVHKSTVGLPGLQQGTTIYAAPDETSRVVVKNAAGDQAVTVLGCSGAFYRVKTLQGTGWTKGGCTNENTTCS